MTQNLLFGLAWHGAPIAEHLDSAAPPVGTICPHCDEPIGPDDSGIIMPCMAADFTARMGAWHRECHMRNTLGCVEHQAHGCDRTCADDPKLTKRQAARAALEYFEGRREPH